MLATEGMAPGDGKPSHVLNQIPGEWIENRSPQDLLDKIHEVLTTHDEWGMEFVETALESLIRIEPDNHAILYLYGTYHLHCQRPAIAEQLFRRTLDLLPGFAPALTNLGVCCTQLGRHDEGFRCFELAMENDPGFVEAYNNYGSSFVNNGTPEKAIEWCNKALALNPTDPDATWNKGLALLELKRWEEGWRCYEAGLRTHKKASQKRKRRFSEEIPLWRGEPGTVGIYGEQGVGDEILAASMLEEASRRADILYECHPRLVRIMRHSFEGIPIYGTRKMRLEDGEVQWPHWTQPIDYKCPIFHLGGILRIRDEDFPRKPYLKPFEEKVAFYREKLASPRLKIGFSWKGGNQITRQDLRSVPLERWIPFFEEIDADWISLQYDPADRPGWNSGIAAQFEKDTGHEINHWSEVVNDLDECYGGLIHALDLVISVNNSLVHACGAYGIPCWTLTPARCAWRYNVEGERMIWYGDHVKQYRQEGEDWSSTLARLKADLHAVLEERTAA